MIKFCMSEEDHKLYAAMQIGCPCFRDKNTPFTQKEVDILYKTLLSASPIQAGTFLIQVAESSEIQHKQLMCELGRHHDLYEHIMGAL